MELLNRSAAEIAAALVATPQILPDVLESLADIASTWHPVFLRYAGPELFCRISDVILIAADDGGFCASLERDLSRGIDVPTADELVSLVSRIRPDFNAHAIAEFSDRLRGYAGFLRSRLEFQKLAASTASKPSTADPGNEDSDPFLGLVFHHDSTVTRLGDDDKHIPPIALAPQPLKLLKFIHEAGQRGRTVNEIVPAIVATKRILTTEKSRFNLAEIDIDLGETGQYVVRCKKAKGIVTASH